METDVEGENPVRSGKRFKERVHNLFLYATIGGCVLFGVCVLGLGMAKFVMGILYLDDCQLQPLLPVYLIVEFCLALTLFLVILVCVYKSDRMEKFEKTEGFSCIHLMVCLVTVLVPLFLFIWFIIARLMRLSNVQMFATAGLATHTPMVLSAMGLPLCTVWVVNLREEINAPGHCKYANGTTSFTSSSPIVTNRNETSTSAAISQCSSCDETFVDFTFGVVIAQWAIIGAILAAAIGALLLFGLIFVLCAQIGG